MEPVIWDSVWQYSMIHVWYGVLLSISLSICIYPYFAVAKWAQQLFSDTGDTLSLEDEN